MNGLTTAPGEKTVRSRADCAGSQIVLDAGACSGYEPKQQNGIQIVHRLGPAQESVFLSIACECEKILHADSGQCMKAGFEKGAISVFAREVSQRGQPVFYNIRRKRFRREGRIASRQIRDADDLDAVALTRRIHDESFRLGNCMVPAEHKLRGNEKLTLLESGPETILRHIFLAQGEEIHRYARRSISPTSKCRH